MDSIVQFYLENASAWEIKDFCEANGYSLEIIGPTEFKFIPNSREGGCNG